MQQEPSATYFQDQAQRCRRLAAQVMDRLMESRLLAAAQTFDELAIAARPQHAAAAERAAE
jgi:hypothetical protein